MSGAGRTLAAVPEPHGGGSQGGATGVPECGEASAISCRTGRSPDPDTPSAPYLPLGAGLVGVRRRPNVVLGYSVAQDPAIQDGVAR